MPAQSRHARHRRRRRVPAPPLCAASFSICRSNLEWAFGKARALGAAARELEAGSTRSRLEHQRVSWEKAALLRLHKAACVLGESRVWRVPQGRAQCGCAPAAGSSEPRRTVHVPPHTAPDCPAPAVTLAETRLTGSPVEALVKSLTRLYKLLGATSKAQLAPKGARSLLAKHDSNNTLAAAAAALMLSWASALHSLPAESRESCRRALPAVPPPCACPAAHRVQAWSSGRRRPSFRAWSPGSTALALPPSTPSSRCAALAAIAAGAAERGGGLSTAIDAHMCLPDCLTPLHLCPLLVCRRRTARQRTRRTRRTTRTRVGAAAAGGLHACMHAFGASGCTACQPPLLPHHSHHTLSTLAADEKKAKKRARVALVAASRAKRESKQVWWGRQQAPSLLCPAAARVLATRRTARAHSPAAPQVVPSLYRPLRRCPPSSSSWRSTSASSSASTRPPTVGAQGTCSAPALHLPCIQLARAAAAFFP